MSLTPAQVDLDPGEVTVIHIGIDASEHRRDIDYAGAVRITSKDCEEMRLGVVVTIEPEVDVVPLVDLHCCCHPKLRRQHWSDHYYCDPPSTDDREAAKPQPEAEEPGPTPARRTRQGRG